jgi:hypothetical protein
VLVHVRTATKDLTRRYHQTTIHKDCAKTPSIRAYHEQNLSREHQTRTSAQETQRESSTTTTKNDVKKSGRWAPVMSSSFYGRTRLCKSVEEAVLFPQRRLHSRRSKYNVQPSNPQSEKNRCTCFKQTQASRAFGKNDADG